MSMVDCNHIRICTFITENEELFALYLDSGAPKYIIGKIRRYEYLIAYDAEAFQLFEVIDYFALVMCQQSHSV